MFFQKLAEHDKTFEIRPNRVDDHIIIIISDPEKKYSMSNQYSFTLSKITNIERMKPHKQGNVVKGNRFFT